MEKANARNVVIFGDSLFKGVLLGDDKHYSISKTIDWSGIEEKLNVKITNKSKFGCTLTRAKPIFESYISENAVDIAVIEYGGNDSDFYWDKVIEEPKAFHASKTELNLFKKELVAVINLMRSKNIKVILCNLPPISSAKYLDWISHGDENKAKILDFLGDSEQIYRYQELYSNAIAEIAKEYGCDFIDVRQKFLESRNYLSFMCMDGIHPNENGQKLIVNAFLDFYENKHKKEAEKE